jgi:chromosome segregation ATPase
MTNNKKNKMKLKKFLFLTAGFATLLVISCGDATKKEGDEVADKNEIPEATLQQLENLKNDWMEIDKGLIEINQFIQNLNELYANSKMDSIIGVVGKLKKEQKDLAMPILDSMKNDGEKIFTVLETFETENANWEVLKEEFLTYQSAIEENGIDAAEAKEKGITYTEVFNEIKAKIEKMKAIYNELKEKDAALKAILPPSPQ